MSKAALRNALIAWLAMMLLALVVRLVPGKVPAWELPTNAGAGAGAATGSLLDLGGKPVGVMIYSSKVACGAHTRALADAVQIQRMLQESPRYAVKVVYGERTEEGARALAQGYKDASILLDPAKKLAYELDFDSYAVVLYRANGRIVELMKERQLLAQPGLEEYLDRLTR